MYHFRAGAAAAFIAAITATALSCRVFAETMDDKPTPIALGRAPLHSVPAGGDRTADAMASPKPFTMPLTPLANTSGPDGNGSALEQTGTWSNARMEAICYLARYAPSPYEQSIASCPATFVMRPCGDLLALAREMPLSR